MQKSKKKQGYHGKNVDWFWKYKTNRKEKRTQLETYNYKSEISTKSMFGQEKYQKYIFKQIYGGFLKTPRSQSQTPEKWDLFEANEERLDVLLFRSHLCYSLGEAKKMIQRGVLFVNGKKIRRANQKVEVGSVLQICPQFYSQYNDYLLENAEKAPTLDIPYYLEIDYKLGLIVFWTHPTQGQFPFSLE